VAAIASEQKPDHLGGDRTDRRVQHDMPRNDNGLARLATIADAGVERRGALTGIAFR